MYKQTSQRGPLEVMEPTMTAREINALEIGIPFSIPTPRPGALTDSYIRAELTEDAPKVTVPSGAARDTQHEILINSAPPAESAYDWKPLVGLSAQYGYTGAIFHPSEFIDSSLAYRLCSLAAKTPTQAGTRVFMIAEVTTEDTPPAVAGRVVLYKIVPR